MHLVTVVHDLDIHHMRIQAASVQKFLVPGITHWVIVNEPEPDLQKYHQLLDPYYTQHELKLIAHDWEPDCIGWVNQQFAKLEIANRINTDYVLLDAKNFFVKHTDLSPWKHTGSGIFLTAHDENIRDIWNYWLPLIKEYCDQQNCDVPDTVYQIETPFTINHKYITPELCKQFRSISQGKAYVSEFLWYSVILHKSGHVFKKNWPDKHCVFWPGSGVKKQFETLQQPHVVLSGIHRHWLETASKFNKAKVRKWLEKLELDVAPELWNNQESRQ